MSYPLCYREEWIERSAIGSCCIGSFREFDKLPVTGWLTGKSIHAETLIARRAKPSRPWASFIELTVGLLVVELVSVPSARRVNAYELVTVSRAIMDKMYPLISV